MFKFCVPDRKFKRTDCCVLGYISIDYTVYGGGGGGGENKVTNERVRTK